MLRHGVRPPLPVNETLPVPRTDQTFITLLRQTGETLESAGAGCDRARAAPPVLRRGRLVIVLPTIQTVLLNKA